MDLSEYLLEKGTYSCGTAHSNRKRWPKDVFHSNKIKRTLRRGLQKSVITANGKVECLMSKDNKVVALINTLGPPEEKQP